MPNRYYQNLDGCDDWNQLSFRGSLVLYEELPGNDMVTFKGNHGFMDVLKHLAKDLPKDCIKFNSEVTKMTWGEHSVKITVNGEEEEAIEADYCIFTGSLGYLKAKEEELFEPR